MTAAFTHITTLLSFVFALALTHLLASATDLVLKRDRVRFSWLQALWMANAMLLLLTNWLSLWDTRGLAHWDIAAIVLQFFFTVLQYFTCSLVSPQVPEDGVLDMREFHARQKRWYIGAVAALGLYAIVINIFFHARLAGSDPHFLAGQMMILPMIVLVMLAIFVHRPWLEALIGLLFMASLIGTLAFLTPGIG